MRIEFNKVGLLSNSSTLRATYRLTIGTRFGFSSPYTQPGAFRARLTIVFATIQALILKNTLYAAYFVKLVSGLTFYRISEGGGGAQGEHEEDQYGSRQNTHTELPVKSSLLRIIADISLKGEAEIWSRYREPFQTSPLSLSWASVINCWSYLCQAI